MIDQEEIAFVGDIHGASAPLESLLSYVSGSMSRYVFLGDYINRGPESRDVIQRLVDFQDRYPNSHFLRGNHEDKLLHFLETDDLVPFLKIGGASTIRSYTTTTKTDVRQQFRDSIPDSHKRFLFQLTPQFYVSDVAAIHDAAQPHPAFDDGSFLVTGHAVRIERVPLIEANRAIIDTGCGTLHDGNLCCLLWPSLRWCLVGCDGTLKKRF